MEAEIEKLKKRLEKCEKDNQRLEKYNSDLQGQVKLSNAKLQIAKTYLYKTAEVQTEIVIDSKEDNENVFTKSVLRNCLNNFDEQTKKSQDLKDMVAEMKQAHSLSDYYYDEKTKTYLSKSTGWYYYPECSAFFNPQDKCYYRYNETTKSYDFLSKLEENNDANPEKDGAKTSDEDCGEIEENEDGEIEDSDYENENEDFRRFCSDGDFSKFSFSKRSQLSLKKIPNVRMIVERSNTLEIGSLLVIGYNGGKLGNHNACSVTIPDPGISPLHTEIYYDLADNHYYVQHLSSKNGTFLNGERLNMLERKLLKHKDRLSIADECDILVHIHSHRDDTCDGCEPGIIRKNIEAQEARDKKEAARAQYHTSGLSVKSGLKNLKRKYGLDNEEFKQGPGSSKLPSGYSDRAARRQKEIGSDNPYEKTGVGTALDVPINEKNKGFQMMKKMGWSKGQAVGTEKDKNTEPIDVEIRGSRAGLGFN